MDLWTSDIQRGTFDHTFQPNSNLNLMKNANRVIGIGRMTQFLGIFISLLPRLLIRNPRFRRKNSHVVTGSGIRSQDLVVIVTHFNHHTKSAPHHRFLCRFLSRFLPTLFLEYSRDSFGDSFRDSSCVLSEIPSDISLVISSLFLPGFPIGIFF